MRVVVKRDVMMSKRCRRDETGDDEAVGGVAAPDREM